MVSIAGFGSTAGEIVADFARTARLAVEAGADAVEANISCPNVDSEVGQIYLASHVASCVAMAVRKEIGDRPLLLKVGEFVGDNATMVRNFIMATKLYKPWYVMTNCPSRYVMSPEGRTVTCGVAGPVLRSGSLQQVAKFREFGCNVIGVGGISSIWDVFDYLKAGAESVQVASAAMRNPTFVHDLKVAISQMSGLVTT